MDLADPSILRARRLDYGHQVSSLIAHCSMPWLIMIVSTAKYALTYSSHARKIRANANKQQSGLLGGCRKLRLSWSSSMLTVQQKTFIQTSQLVRTILNAPTLTRVVRYFRRLPWQSEKWRELCGKGTKRAVNHARVASWRVRYGMLTAAIRTHTSACHILN